MSVALRAIYVIVSNPNRWRSIKHQKIMRHGLLTTAPLLWVLL